jgi:hypothetical protein
MKEREGFCEGPSSFSESLRLVGVVGRTQKVRRRFDRHKNKIYLLPFGREKDTDSAEKTRPFRCYRFIETMVVDRLEREEEVAVSQSMIRKRMRGRV